MEILEVKNTITEDKNSLEEFSSRPNEKKTAHLGSVIKVWDVAGILHPSSFLPG